ncbi:MAG TPA: GNAT family N-acetyltransferase [Chitinophagaceae bacterium]
MKIRNATTDDAAWIADLCHRQFQVAHKGGIRPDDLLYYVDKIFNAAEVFDDIGIEGNYYLVAVSDNEEPLGCLKLGPADLFAALHVPGAIEITRLYLEPGSIGKGIGHGLMKAAFLLSKSIDKTSVWLHVYKENYQAIKFYEKCGFEKAGEQDFPVRQSCPVGWVMKCEIK